MRDLRHGGFHALAVRMHADANLEPAVRRHPHRRLVVARHDRQPPPGKHAGAVRGLLAVGREADADQAAVGLALALAFAPGREADLVARRQQRLLVVAAVVVLAGDIVVRHRRGRNEIVVPHLPRLAADRARDRVDHQFHRKADAGARHAAIGQEAGLVGRDAIRLAAVAAEIVGARQIAGRLPRLERNREWPVGIGAAVDGDLGVERRAAVRVGRRAR